MIKIDNLTISYDGKRAVSELSLELVPGEITGLVGESGSGKSVTALTVMGLLSREAKIESGRVCFDDEVIFDAEKGKDEKLLRSYRGKMMSMVFQEPMTSLNPTMKVGPQVEEQLLIHAKEKYPDRASRKKSVVEAFESVGLHGAEELYDKYPHQLSGGMRQRVMIAMAVILHPQLIIADEPTTALDVTIQNQIVRLLKEINEREKNCMLFITHDLNLARRICTKVAVMKDGKIVESGATEDIFTSPQTDYARRLIAAVPGRKSEKAASSGADNDTGRKKESILKVEDLSVFYKERSKKGFGRSYKRRVVEGADFEIYEGETLGLVGESGCGKSSLCKAILGINKEISGKIINKTIRPQMIFQDPYSSLNPARTIGWQLEEPLYAMDVIEKDIKTSKEWRREQAVEMLKRVGLDESYYNRKPHQLSGGQRQRVSIAQALMTKPKLIFADEPVSALDVTIQDQVLDLLKSLQEEFGIAYLFISHDINVIYRVSDRIMVMKDGKILESGDKEEVFNHPREDYTRELLAES